MKCKFCFAEIEEDVTVCPVCGKELEEPVEETAEEETTEEEAAAVETAEEEILAEEAPAEEKKKAKPGKIALAVSGLVVLALVLTGVVLHFMGLLDDVQRFVGIGVENNIYRKSSYTMDNDKLEQKSAFEIATVGNQVLTNGELQVHYWMSIFDFLDYYGAYASYMGLDTSKPFDQQIYDEETGMTYQQWFLENAVESWRRYATLAQMADEAGFQMTEEQQNELNSLPEQIKKVAAESGYTDLNAFIDKEFYPGCTLDDYVRYNTVSYKALCYFDTLYEGMMPSQDEIEAYYTQHEEEFKNNKMAKENGDYYDVRHILVAIEGGTKDEATGATTYTDAEWEACRAKAQKMLDDFLAGDATEEAFAALAQKNSADPGSASNGGLYENLTKDYGFIKDFESWYVDEIRKPGDTGLVKNTESSVQGYHIMYFSGSKAIWEYETKSMVLSEKTSKMLEDAEAKWPMAINYKKISLGTIDLTAE